MLSKTPACRRWPPQCSDYARLICSHSRGRSHSPSGKHLGGEQASCVKSQFVCRQAFDPAALPSFIALETRYVICKRYAAERQISNLGCKLQLAPTPSITDGGGLARSARSSIVARAQVVSQYASKLLIMGRRSRLRHATDVSRSSKERVDRAAAMSNQTPPCPPKSVSVQPVTPPRATRV